MSDLQPSELNQRCAAVRHLSFCEATVYAEWAGTWRPIEFESEGAAAPVEQAHGVAWPWTRFTGNARPSYRPWAGAWGHYNDKGTFMVEQIVPRGSGLPTPQGRARDACRNFFPLAARGQFSGLRPERDL